MTAFIVASASVLAAELPPPGASSCSICHPGSVELRNLLRGPVHWIPAPSLLGRAQAEIVAAMQAFRSGSRPATVMDRIARGFSDTEVAAIAAWYAEQQP